MNFTFDSLTESTNAIDRLRTFHQRIVKGPWPESVAQAPGSIAENLAQQIGEARVKFTAALVNDLNTARARAAIFDMVSAVNSAADAGTLNKANAEQVLGVLNLFDDVFAVLKDNDAAITRAALAWAETEGRLGDAAPELVTNFALSDAEIDALVAERTQAKKTRNFARADAIRNDLLAKGVLIEDSKDGVRWRRK
jgi:cysteinyl-tRNA synthetase